MYTYILNKLILQVLIYKLQKLFIYEKTHYHHNTIIMFILYLTTYYVFILSYIYLFYCIDFNRHFTILPPLFIFT